MTPGCALFLAGLCLPAPDKASDLHAFWRYADGRTGVAQAAAVEQLGVKFAAYQSDDLKARETTGLPQACRGSTCVLYLKTLRRRQPSLRVGLGLGANRRRTRIRLARLLD